MFVSGHLCSERFDVLGQDLHFLDHFGLGERRLLNITQGELDIGHDAGPTGLSNSKYS